MIPGIEIVVAADAPVIARMTARQDHTNGNSELVFSGNDVTKQVLNRPIADDRLGAD
jgi:hypothetical protein